MSGQVITLETRILPAATTNLGDLNGDTNFQNDSSNAREYTTIGTKTFFTYNSQVTNKPLIAFKDSVTGQTTVLPDQTNFRFSPNTQISELTVYNGKLFFVATDGNPGMGLGKELWSLDPASITIPPGSQTATATFVCITDYDGSNATNVNGVANGAINGRQALTGGSATSFNKNEGSAPAHLTVFNGKLYFTATDDLTGLGANRELYVYDDAPATRGVKLLKDINTTPNFLAGSSDPQQLTNANDTYLYFTAVDAVGNGRELWRTDGTAAGTVPLGDNAVFGAGATNIRPGGQDAGIREITPAGGGVVYFSANDGSHGYELWRTDGNNQGDGATTGTFMVKDIQPAFGFPAVNQGSNPSSLLFMNGNLYFAADDGIVGKELWTSTGAKGNATLIRDIAQTGPGGVFDVKQNSNPHNLTQVGTNIYFSANDGKEGFELWRLDTTTNAVGIVNTVLDSGVGAHPHPGINPNLTSSGDSTASSYPGSLLNVNGTLYFIATDTYTVNGQTDFELYRVNPGTGLIQQVAEQNVLSNVWQSQFDLPDPQQDFTYAKSSADSFRPTEVIQDKSPTGFRTDASNEQLFLGPNGLIYFTADNGANGGKQAVVQQLPGGTFVVGAMDRYLPNFEPWSFDTNSATASIVKDMTVQSLMSLNPFGFTTTSVTKLNPSTNTNVTQTLTFFFFSDPRLTSKNIGLAYTDSAGNTTDTGLRFDSIGTTARPEPVVFGNNSILFIANGKEVWRTNGTMQGTEVVATADVSIDLLTVSGNRYYYYGINYTFSGNTRSPNGELWSGTTSSSAAEQVAEIAPTVNAFNRSTETVFIVPAGGSAGANSVFFNANDWGATNNGSRNVLWVASPDDNNIGTRMMVSAATTNNPTGPQGPRNPYAAASANGAVYFASGSTLYVSQVRRNATNGFDVGPTDLGTFAISPALGQISNITPVTGGLYFVVNGSSLYFSDGSTPAGAVLVGNFTSLTELKATGNRLYFVDNQNALYTTTASILPAVPTVTQINTATSLFNINDLVITGNSLYFSAFSTAGGQELWLSSNQAEPTQVTDIQPGNSSSLNFGFDTRTHVAVGNGRVFFGARDGALNEVVHSIPLGGSFVTALPNVVHPTTASSNARDFIVFDQDSYSGGSQPTVYFFSDVGPQRSVLSRLATSPFDPSGTLGLTTIDTYRNWGRTPGDNIFFDDFSLAESQSEVVPQQYLHFGEYGHPNSDFGIYKSGRTATANRQNGGYLGEQFLFFSGFNSDNTGGNTPFNYGQELYVLYAGAPVRITDLRVASNGAQGNANPGYLTSIGNNADGNSTMVLFAASSGSSTGALYKVTVPATGAPASWAVAQVSAAVNPRYLQSLGGGQGTGGLIYFTAGAENARTAWVTDGNTATQLSTAIVDESAGDGKIFGFSNGRVYFSAREPGANTDNFELYQTNHATGATIQLRDINQTVGSLGQAGSRPGNFTDVNGILYFAATDGIHGFELWQTDGTSAGTRMVQTLDSNGQPVNEINPGAAGSNPGVVISTKIDTDLNGVSTTRFIYTYEGFAIANTRPDEFGVRNAGNNSPLQQNPAKPNSGDDNGTPTLMFAATTSQYGRELWQVTPNNFSTTVYSATNTLNAATTVIEGVTYNSSTSTATFVFNGALHTIPGVTPAQIAQGVPFLSGGVSHLFKSTVYTGNATYAELVKDIAPGSRSSNPRNLTGIDGTVYMSADDGLTGDTLWNSIGLDQITGNTLTVKLIDDASLFAGNSPLVNGIRNPNDFTFLSTNNQTISRLIFTAANDLGKTEVYTLNINHTPTQLNMTSVAVPENLPQGTLVGVLGTTDPDFGDSFQYKFVVGAGDTDNDLFQIVGTSLQIKQPLDFETKSTYTVRIRTTDQRGQFYEKSFTVNVTDVNEFGVEPNDPNIDLKFTDPTTNLDLANDTARLDEVPSVAPTNPPPTTVDIPLANLLPLNDDAITNGNQFTIVPGLDAASFVIDSTGVVPVLKLKAGAILNYEDPAHPNGIYQVDIQMQDPSVAGSAPVTRRFTLILNDLNESPIGPVSDSDPSSDVPGIPFINGSVNENAATGTPVGIVALAIDPDTQLNPVTYTLTNNAGGRFQIVDSVDGLGRRVGVVQVLNGAGLNYEDPANPSHLWTISVLASSSDGTSSTADFVIQVLDVNEFSISSMVDVDPTVNAVMENAPTGTPVGITARAVDLDGSNSAITYSLFSNAGGRFQIDPVTGVISVLNGALINREVASSFQVYAQATSQDGSTTYTNFIINILDENEFAVSQIFDMNAAPNIVSENAPNGTPVGITAFAFDSDATNNGVTYSLFSNAGGRFAINPTTGVITVANSALLDRELAAAWHVLVQATSQDGSKSYQDFAIALADVDEFDIGPVFDVDTAPNSVIENAPNGTTVGVTALAVDKDATATTAYSLLNNAGGRFTIHPVTGVVTVLNGALLDREAAASHVITVLATSSDGSTSQQNFTISLADSDEFDVGPIQNVGSNQTSILEHSPVGSLVGVTARAVDQDATNNQVTYVLTDNSNGRFAINPITGVVTIANSVLFDREIAASFSFTVKATSQDGSTSERTFVIDVVEVNDNPVSDIIDTNAAVNNVNEKAATGTIVGITAFATDPDVGALPRVTYSLQDTSGGRYKIDPVTGVVSVDDGTRIDFETGPSNLIVVKATSPDGSFKTKSFTIAVNDVYEEPVILLSNNTVAENLPAGAAIGVFGVLNATAMSPVYTLVSGTGATNNASFQIVGNQIRTKSTFNFEAKSSYSVRVRMTSSNGLSVTQVFTINVTNVNEAPTGVSLSKSSVLRTSPVGTVVGLLSGVDPDAASTFTYSLVGGTGSTDNAKFTIVGNQLRVNGPLGTASRASIRVRVTDQAGMSYEKTFSISLTR